jgi:hypothetical protein
VDQASFDFLEPIRFFPDIDDSFDPDMSSLKQPKSLLAAGFSLRIRTLRAKMEFVLAQNFRSGSMSEIAMFRQLTSVLMRGLLTQERLQRETDRNCPAE